MKPAVLASCVTVCLLVLGGGTASADDAVQSGWWTSAPVAVAPDAPADGLVVQGGPDANSPTAFAAVSYTLAPDSTPQSLALKVASGSATTPGATLAACPLTGTFTPAQGGAASSAPKYDCGTKVTAAASSDGTGYTFEVANLVQNGSLAIAIVPTTATDRVVFEKPDASALTMAAGASAASSFSDSGAGFDDSSSSASETPLDAGTLGVNSAPMPDLGAPTAVPSGAAGTSATPTATTVAPSTGNTNGGQALANTPAAAVHSANRTPLRGLLFGGLVLVAAVLWALAGSGDGERALADEAAADA